jgi:hypothetical protein
MSLELQILSPDRVVVESRVISLQAAGASGRFGPRTEWNTRPRTSGIPGPRLSGITHQSAPLRWVCGRLFPVCVPSPKPDGGRISPVVGRMGGPVSRW